MLKQSSILDLCKYKLLMQQFLRLFVDWPSAVLVDALQLTIL